MLDMPPFVWHHPTGVSLGRAWLQPVLLLSQARDPH
jgi:hypothetical protein